MARWATILSPQGDIFSITHNEVGVVCVIRGLVR
jgi:hypothetical protein